MPGEAFALRWDHQTNMATPHPTAMTVASVQRAYEMRASMLAVCTGSPEIASQSQGPLWVIHDQRGCAAIRSPCRHTNIGPI